MSLKCAYCGQTVSMVHRMLYKVTVRGTLHFNSRECRDNYFKQEQERKRQQDFDIWLANVPSSERWPHTSQIEGIKAR